MSIAQFSLVRKTPVTVYRHGEGHYEDGDWIGGEEQEIVIQANVHPFSDYQVMMMPESDRTKSWLWLFTADEIRQKKEGVDGYDADIFLWLGDRYEVRMVQNFVMGVRDHFEAKCVRIEVSPN